MFTGQTQPLKKGTSSCEGKSGVCVNSDINCPGSTLESKAFTCEPAGRCCIGLAKSCTVDGDCSGDDKCLIQGRGTKYCGK